jgi:hypothetical protein
VFLGTGTGVSAVALNSAIGGVPTIGNPADFNGDGILDIPAALFATSGSAAVVLGGGNGRFGPPDLFAAGTDSQFVAPGDFNGDGKPDVLARNTDGTLRLYRGTGAGGWMDNGIVVGAGWQNFTAIFPAGDFNGDGHPDVFARNTDGTLRLYRGNGTGGWLDNGIVAGSGWQDFTALAGGGDFNGDGKPDVLARAPDNTLRLYRGTGAGGWMDNGIVVGTGWGDLRYLTLVGGSPPPAPAPPAPAPPPAAPIPGAHTLLSGPKGCTQPGGRLHVTLKVRRVRGRAAPHVRRILFFVRGGPRRADHHRPYSVRLRLELPAGTRGRVYARVYFTRGGSRHVRSKTVSRRFTICG